MAWPLNEFWTAFVVGGVVIAVFAWDQLNRPTYGEAKKLAGMLNLLAPADIGGPGVYLRAYVVYTLPLLGAYAALSLTGEELRALAIAELSEQASASPGSVPRPQETPLYVALVMVGLIPSARLKGFDAAEWRLRRLAHRWVGIPDILFSRRDLMAQTPLTLKELGDGVISPAERRRIEERLRDARAGLGRREGKRVERLEGALVKILAYRSWVLDHGVFPGEMLRARFSAFEDEVVRRIGALDLELDVLAAASRLHDDDSDAGKAVADLLASGPAATLVGEADRREAIVERWRSAVTDAEATAKQFCALMMLYLERTDRLPQGNEVADSLGDHLRRVQERGRRATEEFDRVALIVAATVMVMAFGGVLAHQLGIDAEVSALRTAVHYFCTGALTYGVPVTLVAWWRAARNEEGRRRNALAGQVPRIAPVLPMAMLAGLCALPLLAGYDLVATLEGCPDRQACREALSADPFGALSSALASQAWYALLAFLQAVFVVLSWTPPNSPMIAARPPRGCCRRSTPSPWGCWPPWSGCTSTTDQPFPAHVPTSSSPGRSPP